MATYIYVIGRDDGPVKVGISDNPGARVLGLQTGCPFHLSLLATFQFEDRIVAHKEEQFFHRCYREQQLVGEWFDLSADLAIEGIEGNLSSREFFENELGAS